MTLIKNKIKVYHKKKTYFQVIAGLINLAALLLVVWCSTVFLDITFHFSRLTRWFVLIINGVLSLYLTYRFLFVFLFEFFKRNKDKIYLKLTREIGLFYPVIADKLTNIYQLEKLDSPEYSKELKKYALNKFTSKIQSLDFTEKLNFSDFILPKRILIPVLFSSFIAIASLPDSMILSLKRIIIPLKDFSAVPAFSFNVQPGNAQIIKGNGQRIIVSYSGPNINGCNILFKNNDNSFWQTEEMINQGNMYVFTMEDIRDDLVYHIRGIAPSNKPWHNKILSETYNINTVVPPHISEFQLSITPPSYTKLPLKYMEKNIGDIVALKGSKCNISALVNKDLIKAALVFNDSTSTQLTIRDKRITGLVEIKTPKTYSFEIKDKIKITNQNPIEYSITILEDYFPSVNILEPEEDIESIPDAIINVQFEVNDDFGFTDIKLHYQIIDSNSDSSFKVVRLPVDLLNQKYISTNYLWDLSRLPIGFDESVKYFISARDNDIVSGPKSAKSKFHYIRFPSLDQLFEDFANVEEKNIDEMEDIAEESEELRKELEKIRREFKQDKKLDWDRKKELESTIEKQKELQQQIDNIEKEIEEAVKKLAEKNLFSPEILEKYNQLQELFQDIATPELLKSMQELQKSIDSLDKKKIEQSLNQMTFNQEKFKEKLERTLELFKKIQLEQDLDRLVQMAKKLTEKQQNISEQIEKNQSNQNNSDITKEQQQQNENLQQLSENSESVLNNEQMKSFMEAWEKLNEANKYTKEHNFQEQMNQIQNQLTQNNMKQAGNSSQKLEKQMQNFLSKLKESQAAMNKQNKDEILAKMRKTTNNLLHLSKDEERLMNRTGDLSNLSDEFRDIAQSQKQVSDNMQKVIKDLVDLSKESFFLSPQASSIVGKTLSDMNKGVEALENRDKSSAGKYQKQAMSGLNQAVLEMQSSMQSASQSKSGMGFEQFMQQMQQMAGKQGQLNQQGMEFMQGKGNQGQLSPAEQGQLSRMAAQQEALRRSMEQLGEKMGNKSDVLGRMDNIADEMKKVIDDMQSMNYDRKTIQRQQKILSRMLDAQKSVREKEYSKKRKAETGKQYARKDPEELKLSIDEKKARLKKELKQALQEGYFIDYEKLIEEYFRNLNKEMETK